MLNDFGQENELQLDSQLRLLVTASKQGEQVMLSNQVFDFIEGEYRLIASPAILVANREPAEIHLDTVSSGRVELRFEVDY